MPLDNLIQRADLNQKLTRALEIKGQKSPVLQLDNTVQAVVIADDLTKQAEWTNPTSRKLAASVGIVAVVGQTGILAITNPAGSGVIAVVERITATGGGGVFTFGLVDPLAVPAGAATLSFRDRRNVGVPECRAFSGTDAVLRIVVPYLAFQGATATPVLWYEVEGIVIQPGETFGVQATTANVLVQPTIWLEEIPIR